MVVFVIRLIRENKNMSLYDLSNKTKISRSYLSVLENNKGTNITLDKLYKIANALNVNIKDLFYTELDIEILRRKLNYRINKYGINSKEALELSKIIDILINIMFKELD